MDDKELLALAERARRASVGEFVRRLRAVEDFRYDEVQEKYWDTTTGTLLGARSVDGAIPKTSWPTTKSAKTGKVVLVRPSIAINDVMTGLTVEGSTWWPGRARFIENTVVGSRGAMTTKGAVTYNTYVAPDHSALVAGDAQPWIDHVKKLFPDKVEQEHFFDFAAHMVQRPDEKINHGLVIAGEQGIGKDTALHPLRVGVGIWNTAEIEPDAITSQYNGYVQSVMLVINEVRPHAEDHKASNFYNQLKPLLAAPPDMLSMDLKYANTIYVRNLCHVLLTTNEPLTMYIPPNDRRLFVMTSPLPDPKKEQVFKAGYFDQIWGFLEAQGTSFVINWLLKRPIFEFKSNAPPRMTGGKRAIIESAHAVRRTLVDDLLDAYYDHISKGNRPKIIFAGDLLAFVRAGPWFDDKDPVVKLIKAKNFHFKMDERGFNMVKNPYASEWRSESFRSRVAFVRKDVRAADQLTAVNDALAKRPLVFEFEAR